MSKYTVHWLETWSRIADVDLDEEDLRDWVKVPIGPITTKAILCYLNEYEHYADDGWYPDLTPGRLGDDEFYNIEVERVEAP